MGEVLSQCHLAKISLEKATEKPLIFANYHEYKKM